jgi:hypothetical protein
MTLTASGPARALGLGHGGGEGREPLAHPFGQPLAGRGQPHRAVEALEEAQAELELQGLDLPAHRARRHRQLVGGLQEALVASGRLEGAQRIERQARGGDHR